MKYYYVEVEETTKYILCVEARDKVDALRQGAFEFSVMNSIEKSKAVSRKLECDRVQEVD